jgi:hypothetical protein
MKVAWSVSRLLAPAFRVCLLSVVTLCGTGPLANAASQPAHVRSVVTHEFFCYAGLDHNECLQNIAKLQTQLLRYSADLPKHWSWVIVGSEDWQSVTLKLQLDSRSPAFTSLKVHETFLEEALFLPQATRTDELVKTLGVPVDQLLTIAVSHELGHAICNEGGEKIANRVSDQLRRGGKIDCTSSLAPYEELYLPSRSHGLWSRDP